MFKLPSHYNIYIVKYIFTGRDDHFENLGGAIVQASEMFTSVSFGGSKGLLP